MIVYAAVVVGVVSSAMGDTAVIDHYYMAPAYVHSISKFRSGVGHDFSYEPLLIDAGIYETETDPTETNRSMKHYLYPHYEFTNSGTNTTVPLYAPFTGEIYRVSQDGHESGYINQQVWIQSIDAPDLYAILFHVNLSDTFPEYYNDYPEELWEHYQPDDADFERLSVSSGEEIGYADLRGTISDIAILQRISDTECHYVSYFDAAVMSDEVFSIYQNYGITSRDSMIHSKEYRDANSLPADCWDSYRAEDWVSTVTLPDIAGDTDRDHDVDLIDYGNLLAQFGGMPGDEPADFNDDRRVDLADFALMRAHYRDSISSSPDAELATSVPEPATMSLVALGGLAMFRRRRRWGCK